MNEFKIIIDTAAAGDLDKAIKLLKEYETTAKQAQRESAKIGESFSKSNRSVQDELKKVTLEVNRIEESSKSLDQTQQKSLSSLKKRQQELTKEAQEYAKAQKQAQQVTKTAVSATNGLLGQQVNRLKELRQAAKEANDPTSLQRYNEEIVKTSRRIKQLKADTGSLNRDFDLSKASYNDLTQRNRELRQAMNQLPINSTSAELDRLKREFNSNTQALKRFDAEIGQNFRNVGNYEEAIKRVVTNLRGFGGGLASGIAGGGGLLGGAAGGLAALPQLAAIAGVVQGASSLTTTFNEVNEQLRITSSITDATGQELTDLVGQIRATSTVFRQDYNETLRATNVLIESFGKNGDEALAIINEGLLRGANINGDFLDQISEYSTQFKAAGLEAEQLVATIISGADEGVFSDKAVDAVKEGTIRLRELTTATRRALEGIGLSSAEIERSLESGEKNIADIIALVSQQLATLPPQSARVGTAIADIFGGPGEDAGLDFLLTLQNINKEFDEGFGPLNKYQQKQADLIESQTRLDKAVVSLGETFSGFGDSLSILTNDTLGFLVEQLDELFKLFKSNEDLLTDFSKSINEEASVDKLEAELASLQSQLKDMEPTWRDQLDFILRGSSAIDERSEKEDLLKSKIEETEEALSRLKNKQEDSVKTTDDLNNKTDEFAKTQNDAAVAIERTVVAIEKIQSSGLQSGLERTINGNQSISVFLEAYEAAFSESFLDPTKTVEEEYKEFTERIGEQLQAITEKNKSEQEKQTEDTLRENERRRAIVEESLFAASDIARSVFDVTSNVRDRELQQLEAQTQQQLEAVKGNEEAQIQIRERSEREQQAIRRRQAEAEKKLALFNIAINTASAIVKAVVASPLTSGLPFSAIAAAIGAAQTAAVLSQPIPGFFRGTDKSPEGPAWVGEWGQELVMEKSGRAYLTPQTKSLTYLPKDSRVFTANETKQLMSDSPELFRQSTRTPKPKPNTQTIQNQIQALGKMNQQNIKDVIAELSKQMTVHQYIPNERGIRRFTVKGGKRIESLNKRNSLGGNG